MTEIINLKKTDCDHVDIGRGSNGQAHMNNTPVGERGWIGNPYKLEKHGGDYTLQESIDNFRHDFHQRIENDKEFREAVNQLKGKTLGCYCKPDPCHGDIIKTYLEDNSTSFMDF